MEVLFDNKSDTNTDMQLEEAGMNYKRTVGLNFQSMAYGGDDIFDKKPKSKHQKVIPSDIIGDLEASIV